MAVSESVAGWSKTAADNNDADTSINWSEGQTPGSVNNSARSMMAAIANQRDDQGGALTLGGGTTAYTLTTNQGLDTAYADGTRIHAVVNATNTGASTLNVDSIGAKEIRIAYGGTDNALIGGELPAGYHAIFQYDASADGASGGWILVNPPVFNPSRGPDIILEDQKSQNTAGGTFTSGADRTRDLTTEVRDVRGECSLSSNQFTLPAGTWLIWASAPAYKVEQHQAFLYNVTDTAEVARGTTEYAGNASTVQTRSFISTVVTIAAPKAFEVRHRCNTSQTNNGFGVNGNFGTEVYTRVEITRIT